MGAMRPYIVRQGEYLAKIASELGCSKDEIWEHEKNKELKESGRKPELLHPGDLLFVPECPSAPSDVALGTSNPLSANVPPQKIIVTFHEEHGPIANEAYTATGGGYHATGTSDGEGRVTLEVSTVHQTINLIFDRIGASYSIQVGDLNPIAEPSGQDQRLVNLGYMPSIEGTQLPDAFPEDLLRKLALYEFQRARNLPLTSEADESTKAALTKEHGC